MKTLTPEQIAEKYVYGKHDALTDSQEIKDMVQDIENLVAYELKKNILLSDIGKRFCLCDKPDKIWDSGQTCFCGKCKKNSGCLLSIFKNYGLRLWEKLKQAKI